MSVPFVNVPLAGCGSPSNKPPYLPHLPGKYTNGTGSTACASCEAGRYNNDAATDPSMHDDTFDCKLYSNPQIPYATIIPIICERVADHDQF